MTYARRCRVDEGARARRAQRNGRAGNATYWVPDFEARPSLRKRARVVAFDLLSGTAQPEGDPPASRPNADL